MNSAGRVDSFAAIRQAEIAVDALHERDQPLDLVADLLLHDEAVRIVLRELADARQSRQHARRLVAVQRRLLVKAHRQLAIAVRLAREQQDSGRGSSSASCAICLAFGLDDGTCSGDSAPSGRTSPTAPCCR